MNRLPELTPDQMGFLRQEIAGLQEPARRDLARQGLSYRRRRRPTAPTRSRATTPTPTAPSQWSRAPRRPVRSTSSVPRVSTRTSATPSSSISTPRCTPCPGHQLMTHGVRVQLPTRVQLRRRAHSEAMNRPLQFVTRMRDALPPISIVKLSTTGMRSTDDKIVEHLLHGDGLCRGVHPTRRSYDGSRSSAECCRRRPPEGDAIYFDSDVSHGYRGLEITPAAGLLGGGEQSGAHAYGAPSGRHTAQKRDRNEEQAPRHIL